MKIALYIEDGLEQIVLTPESATEKGILGKIDARSIEIRHGGFYACMGGWTRQRDSEESTILVLTSSPKEPQAS